MRKFALAAVAAAALFASSAGAFAWYNGPTWGGWYNGPTGCFYNPYYYGYSCY